MSVKVPFLELGATYRELQQEIDAGVKRVLEAGWYILGPEVEAFEAEWAAYCGVKHAIGVASGLDALVLALKALDVGPGDEVIVPAHTYIATWLAVTAVGATIVPVEVDEATYVLSVDAARAAITSRTKVLLPVHLYGLPVDMDAFCALAQEKGLAVVEDAAQAHGARVRGTRVGGHGHLVAWSFYPGKNLGAFGDAGAVTTNDAALAARVQRLRNYGSDTKYYYEEVGLNSRLDPIQAAILRAKLKVLDSWNARRAALAKDYLAALKDIPGLTLPVVPEWADPVWHVFAVRSQARDALQSHLAAEGIQTLIHYAVPPHRQRAYTHLGLADALPVAQLLADELLSLPIGPQLAREAVGLVGDSAMRFCDVR